MGKVILLGVGILVLLAAAGGGGYYYGTKVGEERANQSRLEFARQRFAG